MEGKISENKTITKNCVRCHVDKPIILFGSYFNKSRNKRYTMSYCKICNVQSVQSHYIPKPRDEWVRKSKYDMLPENKKKILNALYKDNIQIKDISEIVGVTSASIYNWIKKGIIKRETVPLEDNRSITQNI